MTCTTALIKQGVASFGAFYAISQSNIYPVKCAQSSPLFTSTHKCYSGAEREWQGMATNSLYLILNRFNFSISWVDYSLVIEENN